MTLLELGLQQAASASFERAIALRPEQPDANWNRGLAWLGQQPLNGRTLWLHCEQGLGDTIQFCRDVRLAAAQGARVILEVPEPLRDT